MENQSIIIVHEVVLLYLCKTATKKHLFIEPSTKYGWTVWLVCEIDDDTRQSFCVQYENKSDAKELEKQCVEWLNY